MRVNVLILGFILAGLNLTAQVQFGIKGIFGEGHTSEISKEFVASNPVQIHTIAFQGSTPRKGIGMSLYADNDVLFFMADGAYSVSGRKFALQTASLRGTALDPEVKFETEETDLRLNLSAGFKYKKFKFGFGPELNLTISNEENLSDIKEVEFSENKMQGGFNFLVGYELFNHIHIDVRHSYIFNGVGNEFSYEGIPLDIRSNLKYLELTLGLYF